MNGESDALTRRRFPVETRGGPLSRQLEHRNRESGVSELTVMAVGALATLTRPSIEAPESTSCERQTCGVTPPGVHLLKEILRFNMRSQTPRKPPVHRGKTANAVPAPVNRQMRRLQQLEAVLADLIVDSETVCIKHGVDSEGVPLDWNEWVSLRRTLVQARGLLKS